jgi:DNA-directed RNA polymerase specialized sigma24 family protein
MPGLYRRAAGNPGPTKYGFSVVSINPSHPESGGQASELLPDELTPEPKLSRAERRAALRADKLLAGRCLAGEVAAWEELYNQCHRPLQIAIRVMLGRQSADESLVDEIAARVWYALVANDGELLSRYKPWRGARLITFMRTLAHDEFVRYVRSEVRRRNRELIALGERTHNQSHDGAQQANPLTEFLGTLTPKERVFCNDFLLAAPTGTVEESYSRANIWQLSHRIRRKLLRFLG